MQDTINPETKPLPTGWSQSRDERGVWYYVNKSTSPSQISYTHPGDGASETTQTPPSNSQTPSPDPTTKEPPAKPSLAQQLYASSVNAVLTGSLSQIPSPRLSRSMTSPTSPGSYPTPPVSGGFNPVQGSLRLSSHPPSTTSLTSTSALYYNGTSGGAILNTIATPPSNGIQQAMQNMPPHGQLHARNVSNTTLPYQTLSSQNYPGVVTNGSQPLQNPSIIGASPVHSLHHPQQRSVTYPTRFQKELPSPPLTSTYSGQQNAYGSVALTSPPLGATSITSTPPSLLASQPHSSQGPHNLNVLTSQPFLSGRYISPVPLQATQLTPSLNMGHLLPGNPQPLALPPKNRAPITAEVAARKTKEGAQQTFKALKKISKNALKIAGGAMLGNPSIAPQLVAGAANSLINSDTINTLVNSLSQTSSQSDGDATDLQAVLQGQPDADYQGIITALLMQQQQGQQDQTVAQAPTVDYQALISELLRIQSGVTAQQQTSAATVATIQAQNTPPNFQMNAGVPVLQAQAQGMQGSAITQPASGTSNQNLLAARLQAMTLNTANSPGLPSYQTSQNGLQQQPGASGAFQSQISQNQQGLASATYQQQQQIGMTVGSQNSLNPIQSLQPQQAQAQSFPTQYPQDLQNLVQAYQQQQSSLNGLHSMPSSQQPSLYSQSHQSPGSLLASMPQPGQYPTHSVHYSQQGQRSLATQSTLLNPVPQKPHGLGQGQQPNNAPTSYPPQHHIQQQSSHGPMNAMPQPQQQQQLPVAPPLQPQQQQPSPVQLQQQTPPPPKQDPPAQPSPQLQYSPSPQPSPQTQQQLPSPPGSQFKLAEQNEQTLQQPSPSQPSYETPVQTAQSLLDTNQDQQVYYTQDFTQAAYQEQQADDALSAMQRQQVMAHAAYQQQQIDDQVRQDEIRAAYHQQQAQQAQQDIQNMAAAYQQQQAAAQAAYQQQQQALQDALNAAQQQQDLQTMIQTAYLQQQAQQQDMQNIIQAAYQQQQQQQDALMQSQEQSQQATAMQTLIQAAFGQQQETPVAETNTMGILMDSLNAGLASLTTNEE